MLSATVLGKQGLESRRAERDHETVSTHTHRKEPLIIHPKPLQAKTLLKTRNCHFFSNEVRKPLCPLPHYYVSSCLKKILKMLNGQRQKTLKKKRIIFGCVIATLKKKQEGWLRAVDVFDKQMKNKRSRERRWLVEKQQLLVGCWVVAACCTLLRHGLLRGT